MSGQLTAEAAHRLGRAESRWLEQARLRLRRAERPPTPRTLRPAPEEATR